MLISFVVPVYNVKNYLCQCLDSIICQLDFESELIIVDDGSTDGCSSICDNYLSKHNNIKVIHKENGGLVSARKAGLEIASGEYISCVDSDDWIEHDYVKTIKKYINKDKSDVFCFNYFINSSNKQTKKNILSNSYFEKDDIVKNIYPLLIQKDNFSYFPPAIWAKVFKKSLYYDIQMNVDNRIIIGEDVACSIPCLYLASKITLIDKCLYHYRFNDSSMTKGNKIFNFEDPLLIVNSIKKYINIEDYDFKQQIDRFICHQFIMRVITHFYRNETYRDIKNDIINNMEETFYKVPISNTKIKNNFFGIISLYLLRNKIIFPLYLYSKVK